MGIEELDGVMKYVIVFTTDLDEKPHIQGYEDEEDRDRAFVIYRQTGVLEIEDRLLGVTEEFRPVYAACFDFVVGAVNRVRMREEIENHLSKE